MICWPKRWWNDLRTIESGERYVYYSSFPYADNESIYLLTNEKDSTVLEGWNWEGVLTARYLLDKPVYCLAGAI